MNNIDTLVIIGNGFDIWQKLDTSYFRFKRDLYSPSIVATHTSMFPCG